jgi:outer membrane protein OmpA-like peptidoglycan-associated protein
VDQQAELSRQRDESRLDARTREADAAASELATARTSAADAAEQTADLQRQLDEMQASATDRGMVVTIGDLLFTTGMADLKVGTTSNLNRLVTFLNNYPSRTVMIEGHTDSVGADDYNFELSRRRADSVRAYLAGQGIAPDRLTTVGLGESVPVAENDSAAGRQRNRRVEVIIANQMTSSR